MKLKRGPIGERVGNAIENKIYGTDRNGKVIVIYYPK